MTCAAFVLTMPVPWGQRSVTFGAEPERRRLLGMESVAATLEAQTALEVPVG